MTGIEYLRDPDFTDDVLDTLSLTPVERVVILDLLPSFDGSLLELITKTQQITKRSR